MPTLSSIGLLLVLSTLDLLSMVGGAPTPASNGNCRKTKVAILGAGMAGITAAQTLHNHSITDFIIVEYNKEMGGRVMATPFGRDAKGKPYLVELGANWVQGLASPDGVANPVWTLARKY